MNDESNTLGQGWSRGQLSYRLTLQRKVDLVALCEKLGADATPTNALDHAIALARDVQRLGNGAHHAALEELEAGLDVRFTDLHESLERQEMHAEHIHQNLRGLHRLISTLADGADDNVFAEPTSRLREPVSFRVWLDAAITSAGHHAKRSAIARSTWQTVTTSGPRLADLDLMAELVAVDGVVVPRDGAYPQLVRINLIDSSHPFAAIVEPRPIFLVCQATGQGWTLHAHHATSGGKPGAAIGTHRI